MVLPPCEGGVLPPCEGGVLPPCEGGVLPPCEGGVLPNHMHHVLVMLCHVMSCDSVCCVDCSPK